MTQIASVYGVCIQWHLYEAARIWQLRVPLEIGRNLFCLEFPLWALCAVNSPYFAFYIRRLGRTIFHNYEPWNPVGVPSFSHFHEPKMLPALWASQLRKRKQRQKIFLFFNRTRKRTLLLQPGTVASADHTRSLMSPQMLIKNVQELAKEEGEESEAKLRETIEILEGAVFAIAGSWRDFWGTTS